MRNSLVHRASQSCGTSADRIPTICVVDPQAGDFEGWNSLAEARGVRPHFMTSAEEALRFSRTRPVDLWVVNTNLPGLSGCELCSMLKSRSAGTAVFLVADEYSPTAERSAWSAKATLFGCKPAHATWLAEWLESRLARIPSGAEAESPRALTASH